jgi:RHS repeat-associated protein
VAELVRLQYAAHGGVRERTLGNGVCDYLLYNGRLQVRGGGVFRKISGAGQACNENANGYVNEYYSEFGWDYDPVANNGNVLSHTVTHQGWTPQFTRWFTQSYGYDGLNRLKTATEINLSQPGTVLRRQTYVYDRYGNRALLNETPAPVLGDATPKAVVGADTEAAAGAQFVNNRWTGGLYDAAGNLYQIGTPGMEGYRSFGYDGENRVTTTTVLRGGQTATATNWYDGEGRRVRKVRGTSDTVYVYDAQGQLAGEYGNENPVELGITYGTRDGLGSTRVVTGAGGVLRRRIDYWPFGEEVSGLERGNAPQYGGNVYPGPRDMVDEKFTGKERDAETGLDYFGARYFSGAQGRFTSPDEPLVDQDPSDPQSWNLYSYVRNNPLIFTDPTGLCKKGADGKYHDSEDGPCVAPDSTSITVAEKAPKERDPSAEANAEMMRMQYEAWKRNQERNKPKDDQPLREAARQTLELAYQRTAHDLGCVAVGYGIETAAVLPSMEIVPKRFAPAAAKGGTSIASTILRGGPRGLAIPTPVGTPGTATFAWRSSNTIGGVFGRWLPYVGLGVSVYRMNQCLGWQP